MDGSHTGSLATQPVRGSITLNQSDLPKLSTSAPNANYEGRWGDFMARWEKSSLKSAFKG